MKSEIERLLWQNFIENGIILLVSIQYSDTSLWVTLIPQLLDHIQQGLNGILKPFIAIFVVIALYLSICFIIGVL